MYLNWAGSEQALAAVRLRHAIPDGVQRDRDDALLASSHFIGEKAVASMNTDSTFETIRPST